MKRWPIIRHVRYFVNVWRFNRACDQWARMTGFCIPQQSDLDYLEAIWKGEA